MAKLIPVYKVYRQPLSVYTTLFCFLLLGFVFFIRHQLTPLMFRRTKARTLGAGLFSFVPLFLIIGSLLAIIFYHLLLQQSLAKSVSSAQSSTELLESADLKNIPNGATLMVSYLAFFLMAEGAFILMATKEYLQDAIGIPEADLYSFILEPQPGFCTVSFKSSGFENILVDERYVGTTDCEAALSAGEHTISVKKTGYKTWRENISIKPTDQYLSVWVKMEAAPPGYSDDNDQGPS